MTMKSEKKWQIIALLCLTFLMIGCFGKKRDKLFYEETVVFENENWNYENRRKEFQFEVKSSEKPYKVFFEINHAQGVDLTDLAFAVSFTSPSGGETHRELRPQYADILNQEGTASTIIAYAEKYFNEPGIYTFSLYRRYPKGDLFGIKSVTVKVQELQNN